MNPLNNEEEVVRTLSLLNADASPDSGSGFVSLVWASVEKTHPAFFPRLTPAFALIILSVAFCLILWFHFDDLLKRPSKSASEETTIRGTILEMSAGVRSASIEEGDRLVTTAESHITFFLPGAGYFHLAPESRIELRKSRYSQYSQSKRSPGFPPNGTAGPPIFLEENMGYVSVDKESTGQPSGYHYELFLEEGSLYSKLSKFESGTALNYLTSFGGARVSGTELLLNVEKDSGLSVEVLDGEVMVVSSREPEVNKNIKEGFKALISPHANGTLLVTELEGSRLAELNEQFTQIFGDSEKKYARDTSNFRIVSYKEMRSKK
jgi:hypothetical protein